MTIDITNWQSRKLTDKEMAAIYGVSRATIWRWAKAGAIPKAQKIGANTARWDGAEVAKSMEKTATP
ncbi:MULTISPECIES: helix-turn-helix transcriptional regulator [Thiothrix]|uniref:Helix-turn-helix domain-containing protein n=2 Tax=Thiothrix TaxID=1030 RepID=A0A8B0SME3_9GAMM|nr:MULTISPECIES: helix-turn-helix domain-containing protein [Thiothrix]MBO0613699.1 helix-turn-helix domain-containing protein [Thiothrix fructosivorans]QTX10887.1 helix-turn-helix domain-containing protein [Thiothrix fructosivorans]WML90143.1 helix-turn-helix domain-containing protein [Thiothrix lacustris]